MSVELLPEAEARARTDEIRAAISTIVDDQRRTMELLEAAARDGVHHALGYAKFAVYVDREFRLAFAPANARSRGDIVQRLRRLGLSTRTIAEVTGVSQSTVSRDVRRGESLDSPVQGRDGKTYPQKRPHQRQAPTGATAAPGARARGFEAAYFTAVATIERGVRELAELHEDHRFDQHRARVQPHQRRLERASDVLARVTAELGATRRQAPLDNAA